jgi:hypothetical protein
MGQWDGLVVGIYGDGECDTRMGITRVFRDTLSRSIGKPEDFGISYSIMGCGRTKNNGIKKNITLNDPKTILFLENLKKSSGLTWDQTINIIVRDSNHERDKMLDLRFKEIFDWATLTFPDRPDVPRAIEKARCLIVNSFLLGDNTRMLEAGTELECMTRDLIKRFRDEME